MEQPQPSPAGSKVLLPPTTKAHGIIRIIGFLALLIMPMITVENMGYTQDGTSPLFNMSETTLWIVIVSVGLFCGIAAFPKKWLISGISGLIAAVAMNGFTILYISFRESLNMMEILIPMLFGAFLGWKFFMFFKGNSETERR